MKVKPLKKICKRFDWYISKAGNPVLYDKYKAKVLIIDEEFHKSLYPFETVPLTDEPEEGRWPKSTVLFNTMLDIMFKAFGYSYSKKKDRRRLLMAQRIVKTLDGKKRTT